MAPRDPLERMTAAKAFGEFGGVNASVETSTTFTVLTAETMPALFHGEKGPEQGGCYLYGRSFNPTVRALATKLALLEDTEAAYACASGMAAISSALLALCNHGDHIVASNTVYGGSFALLKTFLPAKCGIHVTFVDIKDVAAVQAAMQPNTKVVYTETVSNPTLVVAPLEELAQVALAGGAQLVVDNTFTPCIISPKHHGADVVVHSMTKFISGASDIIAGAVCGTKQFVNSLMDLHMGPIMLLGPTMDPRIASELALRLPHLALRMQEHSRRALYMAERLEALGAKVTYPGLPSHPQYALLARLVNPGYGLGGLLGLDLGSKGAADAFLERLQNKHGFGYMAVSLGYHDTLMSVSAVSTSSEMEAGDLKTSGISLGYVRMSIGITGSLEQRWQQLAEAYTFVAHKGGAQAPYRAIRVQPTTDGAPTSLLTWPSLGSETCLDDILPPADEAAADATAGQPEGGTATEGVVEAAAPATASSLGGFASAAGAGAAALAAAAEPAELPLVLRGLSPAGDSESAYETLAAATATTQHVAATASVVTSHVAAGAKVASGTKRGATASPCVTTTDAPSFARASAGGVDSVVAALAAGGGAGGVKPEMMRGGSIRKVRRLADGVEVVYVSTGVGPDPRDPTPTS